MSLIEREKLIDHLDACLAESDGKTPITDAVLVAIKCAVEQMPEVDAVPTDFHDRCMQAEIQKRIRLEKIAELLCDGYLDMPCGCDGCPLVDTMVTSICSTATGLALATPEQTAGSSEAMGMHIMASASTARTER